MPGKTLLIVPSTAVPFPTSIASAFSVRGFTHVALIGDDVAQLEKNEDAVLNAIQERGYSCQTKTYVCQNLQQADSIRDALDNSEVATFGSLQCVVFHVLEGDDEASTDVFEQIANWARLTFETNGYQGSPTILVLTSTKSANTWQQTVGSLSIGPSIHVAVLAIDQDSSVENIAQQAWQLYNEARST